MEKFSLTNADNKSQVQTKKIPQYTVYRYGFMENPTIYRVPVWFYGKSENHEVSDIRLYPFRPGNSRKIKYYASFFTINIVLKCFLFEILQTKDYIFSVWKIPLSPSTPTMFLNFVWGKKQHIPSPPHPVNYWRLYIPLADWPVGHMIDWLLPVGGGFALSTHAYKHAIRIHWCQNQHSWAQLPLIR